MKDIRMQYVYVSEYILYISLHRNVSAAAAVSVSSPAYIHIYIYKSVYA